MSKADAHWVRDSLVEDAMESAKVNGSGASTQDALDFIVPILEGMDQKEAEGKYIKKDRNASEKTRRSDAEMAAQEFQKRARDKDGAWTVTKRQHDLANLLDEPKLSPLEEKMVARLRLLRSKPDLRKQMEALVPGLNHPKPEIKATAERKLYELLDRSNVLFGDWRKTTARKLYF